MRTKPSGDSPAEVAAGPKRTPPPGLGRAAPYPEAGGSRAGRWLVGGWLVATAVVLSLPGPNHPLRLALVVLHLALAHLLFERPFPGGAALTGNRSSAAVADWAPLLIAPIFYWEAPLLASVLHGPLVFDAVVEHWDQVLFHTQPSQWLTATWPSPWISEPLHAAYLSYYLFVALPPLALYFSGRLEGFRRVGFTLALAFIIHSAIFAIFPVLGPRYLFPAPQGPLDRGLFYQLAHRLLEAASSPGTAFPSSHVGLAAAITVSLHREMPRITPWAAALAAALALGTVYGGFHYGADALAGAVLGTTLGVVAPSLRDLLSGVSVPVPHSPPVRP